MAGILLDPAAADPGYLNAYNTLAVLYRRLGVNELAERSLRFVMRHDPRNVAARASLGKIRLQAGDRERPRHAAALPRAGAAHQPPDHAGAADAARDLVAPARQLVGHQRGGAVFLEGQFGVLVDVAAQMDELADPRPHRVEQVGHGRRLTGLRA